MKKNIIALSALIILGLASCKKDRNCECKYTDTFPGSTAVTETYTLIDVSKGTAKKACIDMKSTYGTGTTYTETIDCELK